MFGTVSIRCARFRHRFTVVCTFEETLLACIHRMSRPRMPWLSPFGESHLCRFNSMFDLLSIRCVCIFLTACSAHYRFAAKVFTAVSSAQGRFAAFSSMLCTLSIRCVRVQQQYVRHIVDFAAFSGMFGALSIRCVSQYVRHIVDVMRTFLPTFH